MADQTAAMDIYFKPTLAGPKREADEARVASVEKLPTGDMHVGELISLSDEEALSSTCTCSLSFTGVEPKIYGLCFRLLVCTQTAATVLTLQLRACSASILSATMCSDGHEHALEPDTRLLHLQGSHVFSGHMEDGLDVSDYRVCTAHGDAGQLLPPQLHTAHMLCISPYLTMDRLLASHEHQASSA